MQNIKKTEGGTLWGHEKIPKLKKIEKKRKMRILNSLIVPKNVKGGALDFFNIHTVAKYQKN